VRGGYGERKVSHPRGRLTRKREGLVVEYNATGEGERAPERKGPSPCKGRLEEKGDHDLVPAQNTGARKRIKEKI